MWYSAVRSIVTLLVSLLAVPLAAVAQPVAKISRIGVLSAGFPPSKTDAPFAGLDAFRQGLRDLGYVEGQAERFPALAAELVGLPVDLIVLTCLYVDRPSSYLFPSLRCMIGVRQPRVIASSKKHP